MKRRVVKRRAAELAAGTARRLNLDILAVVGVAADRLEKLAARRFLAPRRVGKAISRQHPAARHPRMLM